MDENPVVVAHISREHMLVLQLKHRIRLEMIGMKASGGVNSAYTMARERLGLKGNRRQVAEQLDQMWEDIIKDKQKKGAQE